MDVGANLVEQRQLARQFQAHALDADGVARLCELVLELEWVACEPDVDPVAIAMRSLAKP